jgi:hypothetical protein
MKVTCEACGHPAEISAPSDVWKCNCWAGVGPDDCDCDASNEAPGTEDLTSDTTETAESEIARLESRLITLRGGITPEGEKA